MAANANVRILQTQLRSDLLPWLVTPCLVLGHIILLVGDDIALPPSTSSLGVSLILLAGITLLLRGRAPNLAAWFFSGGVFVLLFIGHRWFPSYSLDLAMVLPIMGAGLIFGLHGSLLVLLASAALLWLPEARTAGITADWLCGLGTLTLAALMAAFSQRLQRTMITWSWQGYDEARRNLVQARDRQMELKQALDDLDLATKETVRLNDMLSVARNQVQDARKAKEEFVANVSHELRTPLNMIIGFSDMILESPEVYGQNLSSALLADIAAIRRNSRHLATLVNDVLDLSEADMGRLQLFCEWVPLYEIAAEATQAVGALFRMKGLALYNAIDPSLPAIWCDRTRIRQVLLNLLNNAGRFTDQGGVRLEASVCEDLLQVSVVDTGQGMTPSKLAMLFEPFQQGDQTIRRRYGGSGLGLSISKRFVERHKGRIWIDSTLGQGTTVSFTLPLEAPDQAGQVQRWFAPHTEGTERGRMPHVKPLGSTRTRVVTVEHGTALSDMIARHVEALEPVPTSDIRQAASLVDADAAHAIVINESSLPNVQDAYKLLGTLSFDVPIMSCWVPEKRERWGMLGAQDYLVKPVNREQLVNSIRNVAPHATSILFVDDSTEAQQLYGRMLGGNLLGRPDRKVAIMRADDGQQALEILCERHPDLLVLDLVMPGMDGFGLLAAKQREPAIRDIPVIILSGKDPQQNPIVTQKVTITRQGGLSAHDLMATLEALTHALTPRFGALEPRPDTLTERSDALTERSDALTERSDVPEPHETPAGSPVS